MLEREQIIRALSRLSDLLKERNAAGEVCLLGGTAMLLGFKARPSTKDIDAIFAPAGLIRELAAIVQQEQNLPENWINDSARGFISAQHETVVGDLPQFENLRLTMPTPAYLLAMKCIASRIFANDPDRGDVADIRFLIEHMHLRSSDEALSIVRRYYPPEQIPVRAQFVIEDIFAQLREKP